jgi:hypothetical protein
MCDDNMTTVVSPYEIDGYAIEAELRSDPAQLVGELARRLRPSQGGSDFFSHEAREQSMQLGG